MKDEIKHFYEKYRLFYQIREMDSIYVLWIF